MTPLLRKLLGLNWVLVIAMYAILIFGLFAIESAARHLALGGEHYADLQKRWILLGSVVYFAAALIDYRWVRWLGVPAYLGGLTLTIIALKFGNDTHQIEFAGQKFQPAPAMIAAGIICIASVLQVGPKWHVLFRAPFVRVLIIGLLTAIPFVLVVLMGDMGSALVWGPVAGVILLVTGIPWRYLILLTAVVVGMVPIAYFAVLPTASERGTQRIEVFLEGFQDGRVEKTDDTWGAYWSSTAVGKAGWDGLGWNAREELGSIHARGYIPKDTAHNDYIYAVIGEEQGFRGGLLLITGFALLLIQCLFIAFYSRDLVGRVIVGGVVALFFAHIFENIGMTILIMPITGIPLPLVSYSGTFVLICMFLLGLVQSVWVHRNYAVDQEIKKGVNVYG